jgi:hypothetical protein
MGDHDRNDHDRIEELISVRALGGLDGDDKLLLQRLMAEHGPDCERCRALTHDYAEVAGRLGFAPAPVEIRPSFEDETVARAIRARSANARTTQPWLRGLLAAAAAVALFASGWVAADVAGGPRFGEAGARVVAFEGDAGDLAVAYRPGARGAYLFGSGLRSPAEGRVLEVWMIRGASIARGACLRPAADGSLATFVDADLASADAMAVTVEPERCPAQPTTDPILTADVGDAA